MQKFYKDKTVWITGASSGIGEAMALQLAGYGAVLILSSENETELSRVQQECQRIGAECTIFLMNQSDCQQVNVVTSSILEKFNTIDVLILNAGISQRASAIETDISIHDKLMQINFRSNVQIAVPVFQRMKINGRGNVGVTSSISGKFGFFLRSTYSASKHALHGYFESAGMELRKDNIFVTLVCPGRVKTDISVHALHGDGKSHGTMDAGQAGGISAQRCAHKYLKAICKGKREKLIGGSELLMAYFKRFCPPLFHFMAKKIKHT